MPAAVPIRADLSALSAQATGDPWWNLSLTSGWLVFWLALIAIGATVAAAVTWDVDRYKRTRRAGLMVTAQLFTALAIAAAANLAGGFYGSLSDLAGIRANPQAVVGAGPAVGRAPAVEPWLARARRASGSGHGVWTPLTVSGTRTGYQLPAWVYVPDAYFDADQPDRRFPVAVLLSGFPGAVENWQRQGHVVPLLDQLIASHKIPPMIFIAVSQNPVANRDSECVDAVGGARADTYLGEDVPDAVADHFRVLPDRSAWSLIGYSTGGYCAVDLAIRHPDRFASAVSLDGYFAPAEDATTGDLFHNHADVRRAFTTTATVRDARPVPVRFYLSVGGAEPTLQHTARAFAALVRAPDTATVVPVTGGHNWGTWVAALPAALGWVAAGIQPADARPPAHRPGGSTAHSGFGRRPPAPGRHQPPAGT